MNWMGITIFLICILSAVRGSRRGFVKMIISAMSFLLVLGLASLMHPLVNEVILRQTKWESSIEKYCDHILGEKLEQWKTEERTEQIAFMETLEVPEYIRTVLVENNNRIIYEDLAVNGFREYISAYLATLIRRVIAYLVAFGISMLVVKVGSRFLIEVSKAPGLGFLNRGTGFCLGLLKGIFLICFLCLLLALFSGTDIGSYLVVSTKQDWLACLFYEQNPLVRILFVYLM